MHILLDVVVDKHGTAFKEGCRGIIIPVLSLSLDMFTNALVAMNTAVITFTNVVSRSCKLIYNCYQNYNGKYN